MADFIGSHDGPLFSFREVEAALGQIKTSALAAQRLSLEEEDDAREAAFFAGAEWALIEIEASIKGKLGLDRHWRDDWVETV